MPWLHMCSPGGVGAGQWEHKAIFKPPLYVPLSEKPEVPAWISLELPHRKTQPGRNSLSPDEV